MKHRVSILLCALALAAGCAKEPQPRSVNELLDNPMLLESLLVRCAQNRSETRYDAECVSARQAVSIIEAREERERRDAFEAESARKRDALRRTQRAASEARRRAAEAERLRKEAEYLAQFGELPPSAQDESATADAAANAPTAVIPEPGEERFQEAAVVESPPPAPNANAPAAESAPPEDLSAIREELRRRNEQSGN